MLAFAILALTYVLSQFYRSFLAVLSTVLQSDIGATATDLSHASGAWFCAFALMQFPVGYALDNWGPRRTTAVLFAIGAGGGAALFAVATTPLHLVLAMVLVGIGCSPILMAAFFLFARNFEPARFATLASLFIAVGTLGNIAGAAPLAIAVEAIGWRSVAGWLGAVSFAFGLAVWFVVGDPARVVDPGKGKGGFLELFAIPQLWPVYPCILLGYAVAAGVRGLWAGPLLADVYGLDTIGAGRVILLMAIALSLGTLAYGPLDALFDSRKKVVMGGNLVVLAATLWLAIAMPQSVPGATLLLMVIGFFGASYAVQFAHGRSFVPAHLVGRGVTLMNFFSIGGVGLMQFISGELVKASTVPGEPATAYHALFTLYAVSLGLALAIYAFSTDSRPSDHR